MEYSKEFKELVRENERELLDGSGFMAPGNFETWTSCRRPIAGYIDRPGSILDVGCGNGFLLKCLSEWSRHDLVPFGFDINARYIEDARRLWPEHGENFWVDDIFAPTESLAARHFDFIFWCVFDPVFFAAHEEALLPKRVFDLLKEGGSLILGMYASGRRRAGKIKTLKSLGYGIADKKEAAGEIFFKLEKAP